MPIDPTGRWYNTPGLVHVASPAPAVYGTGAHTLDPFVVGSIEELLATLHCHAFLRTSLTGGDNDLDIIALVGGAAGEDISVELRDPSANSKSLSVEVAGDQATVETDFADTDGNLVFTAVHAGTAGDDITVELADPDDTDQVLDVQVTSGAIVVSLATDDDGAITSTGRQVAAALNDDVQAAALVTATLADGASGSGVVEALEESNLADGSGPTIIVHLATNSGGTITSTASQVLAALRTGDAAAYVHADLAPGNSGTGVVTALSETSLGDWLGTSPTANVKLQASADGGATYADSDSGPFAQATGDADDGEAVAFVGLGTNAQWVVTVGGTDTPLVAVSITADGRQDI